ncbi:hypothetical protein [Marinactinospora rubrisoli]|uniref:DUF4232 domain-containing protein n=1 Tax=Marinactinospora rubrisoli TaxID=2715399 RepID=A0ABW2KH55_9ACTN
MSPETYWKRRVFVLAGVLVVVALIAYACSGSSSDDGERAASVDNPGSEASAAPDASSSPSIPATPPAGDGEDGAEPSPGADGPGAQDGSGDAGAGPGPEAGPGSGSGGDGGGGDTGSEAQTVAAPEEPGDPCRPQDVVVTVEADETDYAAGEEPRFTITAVNTGAQTCTVDVGRKNMELRITSGDDRIFSTADCVEGREADNEQLRRGVPVTRTVEWDRTRSWTDCREADVDARPGTYVATLHSDYDEGAEPQVFRLN